MAKNREPEKSAESESGEEEESSSEELDSSDFNSETEQGGHSQILKKPVTTPSPKKPRQQPSTPSGYEETGSESDSDVPDTGVRPLSSKATDGPPKSDTTKKPKSKPKAADPPSPAKPSGAKRPAEAKESESKENKRLKQKPVSEPESSAKKTLGSPDESKKLLFQRLWSEDDEIVILKGMIDYKSKKKSDPGADLNSFHEFIKKNLHVDVTRVQLQDKIRRLRKKYENNMNKEREGKDRTFWKPHELKAYELSKIVWGKENGKETVVVKVVGNPKVNDGSVSNASNKKVSGDSEEGKNVEASNGDIDLIGLGMRRLGYSGESMEERIMRIGTELFEREKNVEGEREWRKLKQEEIDLHLKKLDLMRARTKLVLDALNQ